MMFLSKKRKVFQKTEASGHKIIKKYQSIPFKSHDSCKFIPTCSNYMIEALEEHGLIKGLFLGTKRLLRCNPFTNEKYTYDPVPKKKTNYK